MSTIQQILKDTRGQLDKGIEAARHHFSGVRSGKASPALLEGVKVEAYGSTMPLNQVAGISAPEPRILLVTPYDKGQSKAIEKAIRDSDLGLEPSHQGGVIRVPLPAMNEQRRKELVKVVHGIAEQGRVGIRNIRREVMHDLRELKSEGEVGSDDEHRAESELQKLTDDRVGEIDKLLAGKEEEILEV